MPRSNQTLHSGQLLLKYLSFGPGRNRGDPMRTGHAHEAEERTERLCPRYASHPRRQQTTAATATLAWQSPIGWRVSGLILADAVV